MNKSEVELNPEGLRTSVEGKFLALSPKDIADLRPVSLFSQEEIDYMRAELIEAGVNLELDEKSLKSLSEKEFRSRPDRLDFSGGRDQGVVTALGEERATNLINWSYAQAIELGWKRHKIEGIDKTQGRGIQQAAVDILNIVLSGHDKQKEHLERLRQRAWVGQRRSHVFSEASIIARVDAAFEDVAKPEAPSKIASAPPGSLLPLWQYLTTRPDDA